jgi:hypothetical protein
MPTAQSVLLRLTPEKGSFGHTSIRQAVRLETPVLLGIEDPDPSARPLPAGELQGTKKTAQALEPISELEQLFLPLQLQPLGLLPLGSWAKLGSREAPRGWGWGHSCRTGSSPNL